MAGKPTITYVWNVRKHIEFAKSWLEHYHVSQKDIDKVFAGTEGFVKKYSKKPPKYMTSKEIEKQAFEDAKTLQDKIEPRLENLKPKLSEHRIKKILYELPDGEDLTCILLSYRIHNTEDRIRVRKPIDSSIKASDIDAKSIKNKTVNNE